MWFYIVRVRDDSKVVLERHYGQNADRRAGIIFQTTYPP